MQELLKEILSRLGQIGLKVELVLLLYRCMVAVVADHNEDGRSCWLSAGGWELFVFVVRSCLP